MKYSKILQPVKEALHHFEEAVKIHEHRSFTETEVVRRQSVDRTRQQGARCSPGVAERSPRDPVGWCDRVPLSGQRLRGDAEEAWEEGAASSGAGVKSSPGLMNRFRSILYCLSCNSR